MNERLNQLLAGFDFDQSSAPVVASELTELGLPLDYLSVVIEGGGGEGFIGEEYLILWNAGDLIKYNSEYEVDKYAPGIFLFGSNGGGEGFGFDRRNESMKVVQIPFIGMDLKYATIVADGFTDLLERMRVSDGSLL